MAVDTNFLATTGFAITNVGGRTLTLAVQPNSDGKQTPTYKGWKPWIIGTMDAIGSSYHNAVLSSVNPGMSYTMTVDGQSVSLTSPYIWNDFVQKNPIHIKKMNIRCSSAAYLPSQIIIKTPDTFAGQWVQQIIDVSAAKNAYQYQNDIVTVDCDVIIGRQSIVEFSGIFSAATAPTLYVDLTVDYYMSLEKGLVENIGLLKTSAGATTAMVAELQKANSLIDEVNGITATPVSGSSMNFVDVINAGKMRR